MAYLIAISILWSFSFGIIKYGLAGIDSSFISFTRNLIALTFFSSVTIYNIKKFSSKTIVKGRTLSADKVSFVGNNKEFTIHGNAYLNKFPFSFSWNKKHDTALND